MCVSIAPFSSSCAAKGPKNLLQPIIEDSGHLLMRRPEKTSHHLPIGIFESVFRNPHTILQTGFPPSQQLGLPIAIPDRSETCELRRATERIS